MDQEGQGQLTKRLDEIINNLILYNNNFSSDFVHISLFHGSREFRNYLKQELNYRLSNEKLFKDFIIFSTEEFLGRGCYPINLDNYTD
jgi:hypothetical protein